MKKIWCILSIGCMMIFLLAGCGAPQSPDAGGNETQEGRLSVCASFYPMYDFAVKIGGDKASVVNMVPAGTEPHDWEPAASDIVALENADVFVYNGAGMEHWALEVLDTLQNEALTVVCASAGIELLEGHDEHGDEEESEEEEGAEFDPHVWLDPMYAKREMENIKNAFVSADPGNADYYEANYAEYADALDALDTEFRDALADFSNRDIIVAHEAFGYLCAAYGLNQVPIEGLSPDSEPDPAKMAEIIDFARDRDIKVIFFEELVSPKVAETVADAIGAETDVLNPIEGPGDGDAAEDGDYFSAMRRNLESLKIALR